MLKKTVTYKDYNEVERTEELYFHLSEAELVELECSVGGGYTEMLKAIVAAQDSPSLMKYFKELVMKAYGKKSLDGKYLDKDENVKKEFLYSPAYSVVFMELVTDAKAASEFMNKVIPEELAKRAQEEAAKQGLEVLK